MGESIQQISGHAVILEDEANGQPSGPSTTAAAMCAFNMQEEARRLEQRQKQIDFGKNTLGYQNYLTKIPKEARKWGDPKTPDATMKDVSKKKFDGQIKAWRRQLHLFDESANTAGNPIDEALNKKRDHQRAFVPATAELDPKVQKQARVAAGKENAGQKTRKAVAGKTGSEVDDLLRWADEEEIKL